MHDGEWVYRDKNHLTPAGSYLLQDGLSDAVDIAFEGRAQDG